MVGVGREVEEAGDIAVSLGIERGERGKRGSE